MSMFDLSEIYQSLGAFPDRVEKVLMKYGSTQAEQLEAIAKENKPWTNHTSHALQRLHGDCIRIDTGIRISLAHGVEYGVYLEFANEKRYAVIYPTLQHEAPGVMYGLQGLFDRV